MGLKKQQCGIHRTSRVADQEHTTPVESVGSVTSGKREQDTGKKLNQANIAEIKRPMRHLKHLPADRYRLHLGGDDGQCARSLKEAKITVLKRGSG